MTDETRIPPEEKQPGPNVTPLPGHEPLPEGEEEAPPGVRTMAIVRWALVALMAVAAAVSVASHFGLFERAAPSASATQYYCPMHPSVVQDHPGECPICSMTLVEKTGRSREEDIAEQLEDEEDESGAEHDHGDADRAAAASSVDGLAPVTLTPERIQLMGMRTARVERVDLVPEIRTVGFVTANERGLAQIHTRYAGWIEQLVVAETGQRVARGQVLATIYSPELLTAQQEFLSAAKWASGERGEDADPLAGSLAEAARRRLELLGVSREEIERLAATGKATRALEVRSPVAGYVTRRNAVSGLYVQPGTELFEVADLSTVWVLADVYEYEVERVQKGATARFEPASRRSGAFTGRVQFLYPTLDPDTRTLRVRVEIRNPGLTLRPGTYGDVVLELPPAKALVVPADAIVDTGEVQYVFIAREGGRFVPRRVRVGSESNGDVEVLEGLREGETVVTTANFLVDSESRLQAAISGESSGQKSGQDRARAAPQAGGGQGPDCERDFDRKKVPDKYQACRACEVQHRGMGTMEEDCKNAIPKPWG